MVYLTIMTRIWDFSQIAAVTPTTSTVHLNEKKQKNLDVEATTPLVNVLFYFTSLPQNTTANTCTCI